MDIMQEMSTLRVMLDRAVTEAKERGRVLAKCVTTLSPGRR